MAKRDRTQNPKVHQRWNDSGRGRGDGADYQPWLSIQDFAGMTKCSRIKGWKTGRSHHLFNKLELQAFYLLDWDDSITDIREQFPIPLEESRRIAETLNIPHPKSGGGFVVVTTTFLINRGKSLLALEVSPNPTSKTKIVEEYWKTQKVRFQHWGAVNADTTALIEWVHPYRGKPLLIPEAEMFAGVTQAKNLKAAAKTLDPKYGAGATLQTFRTLLANKQWGIPMDQAIDLQQTLTLTHRHAH